MSELLQPKFLPIIYHNYTYFFTTGVAVRVCTSTKYVHATTRCNCGGMKALCTSSFNSESVLTIVQRIIRITCKYTKLMNCQKKSTKNFGYILEMYPPPIASREIKRPHVIKHMTTVGSSVHVKDIVIKSGCM